MPQESMALKAKDTIILPAMNWGSFSYDDSLIAVHRLGDSDFVRQTLRDYSWRTVLKNTASERSGTGYIGDITWFDSMKLAYFLGGHATTNRQLIDFKKLLEAGIKEKKKVFNGKGNRLPREYLQRVHDEIFARREPYRGEWLDADFKVVNGVLRINHSHIVVNEKLIPKHSDVLISQKLDDGYVNQRSFNHQGIAEKLCDESEIYQVFPIGDNNSVARFDAGSGWAGLNCDRNPSGTIASLGVRLVAPKNSGVFK